jgi:hypothetical protein
MRSNKAEVIEFLSQAKKSEIVAGDGASPDRIHWAKIESAAFFRYLAEAFGAQIAADTGASPSAINSVITAPASLPLPRSVPTSFPLESVKPDAVDGEVDDDDELIIDIPEGYT